MRLSDLAEAGDDSQVTGFAIDHRKVTKGNVFGAFKGAVFNGEDFIPAAVERGAVAVVARPQANVEGVAHLADEQPRRLFAQMASRYFEPYPDTVVAVTGTNGKTSTVEMTRQIWRMLGHRSASIGTLGVTTSDDQVKTGLTTPDIVTFLNNIAGLKRMGISHVAYEASSHGLDQFRAEGVPLAAAAFTNFSRDHLDYHPTMEDYFEAKMRLFDEVIEPGGIAVVWTDDPRSEQVAERARRRGLELMTVGRNGETIRLVEQSSSPLGQTLLLDHGGNQHRLALPLIGAYQASNVMTAAALVLATGGEWQDVFSAMGRVSPVRGRLERAVISRAGAPVYIDYAHTPDAIEAAIQALRPHVEGKLITLFGAGGDRDPGKREPMGQVAARLSDIVIVTDDNPRSEDPAKIRADIMAGAPGAIEVAGRRDAIARALEKAKAGDIVLLAGKGHETGQIVGDQVLPFDDALVARECASLSALWTSREIAEATGGTASAPFEVSGVTFDSREVAKGDLFVAMPGTAHDGHDFVGQAIAAGASGLIVSKSVDHPQVLVADTAKALEDLGRAARARTEAKVIGVTGSVGKTSTKEALFAALERWRPGKVHRSVKSYNNHTGVPLSLARMPRDSDFAVLEMGMNNAGEIAALTRLVRPDVALVTAIAPAHIENLGSIEAIADAKAEIFQGLEPDGVAILPNDSPQRDRLVRAARKFADRIVTFGAGDADIHALHAVKAHSGGSLITAALLDSDVTLTISQRGEHWVSNALAVLAAVEAVGGDVALAGLALADFGGLKGRGERHMIRLDGGEALVIDESYNANPASMAATLKSLGTEAGVERRIAVLGPMRELGEHGDALHADLAPAVTAAKVDALVLVGEDMAPLEAALDGQVPVTRVADAQAAADAVSQMVRPGDAILVKASNSVGLAIVVDRLTKESATCST